MLFTKNTSRLVEGRDYWRSSGTGPRPYVVTYWADMAEKDWLWGDEIPVPTVEVEPEPPAWVPPVCLAGQAILSHGAIPIIATRGGPLHMDDRYPPPAWPPRIGEIVEVLLGNVAGTQWVQHMVTGAPERYASGPVEYCRCGDRVISSDGEGKSWRWVYRDLSGYAPPGGSNV